MQLDFSWSHFPLFFFEPRVSVLGMCEVMGSYIPSEVWGCIFSFVESSVDRASCSVVCRVWKEQVFASWMILDMSYNCKQTSSVLSKLSPTRFAAVTHVDLSVSISSFLFTHQTLFSKSASYAVLKEILTRAPHVTSLILRGIPNRCLTDLEQEEPFITGPSWHTAQI